MKHHTHLFTLLISIHLCAQQPQQASLEHVQKSTFVGDINGDGQPETATAEFDQTVNADGDRENDCGKPVCEIKIEFGNGVGPISLEAMNLVVQKQFDVNGDNANEVLVYRWWYECCWVTIDLYSYKTGEWQIIATAKAFVTGEEDDFRDRIRSDGRNYYLMGQKWDEDHVEIITDKVVIR